MVSLYRSAALSFARACGGASLLAALGTALDQLLQPIEAVLVAVAALVLRPGHVHRG